MFPYVVSLMFVNFAVVVSLDNSFVGQPTIECRTDSVYVQVTTSQPFLGRIFVKGMSNRAECGSNRRNNSVDSTASIEIKFATCGMQRERKLSPGPGVEQSLVVVVSFHYLFVTKMDKAYQIQCFYGQRDTQFLTYTLNISMIPTDSSFSLEHVDSNAPKCSYEVRKGYTDGPLVTFAEVGDQLVHKWQCFGGWKVLIRNCYVTDGKDEKFLIIDARGCPVDSQVLPQLKYVANVSMAYVESQAFKFADTTYLAFSCSLRLCNPTKENCDDFTPPYCFALGNSYQLADPPALEEEAEGDDEIDISSLTFNVLDNQLSATEKQINDKPSATTEGVTNHAPNENAGHRQKLHNSVGSGGVGTDEMCITKIYFVTLIFVVVGICLTLAIGCLAVVVGLRNRRQKLPYFQYF